MRQNDPAAQPAAEAACTEREKAVLMACFRAFAGQPMNERDPLLCMKGRLSGAETRAAIVGLRRKGWLKAVIKTWGERLLYIPAERLEMSMLRCFSGRSLPSNGQFSQKWSLRKRRRLLSIVCFTC